MTYRPSAPIAKRTSMSTIWSVVFRKLSNAQPEGTAPLAPRPSSVAVPIRVVLTTRPSAGAPELSDETAPDREDEPTRISGAD
jgi:hypothetical protein